MASKKIDRREFIAGTTAAGVAALGVAAGRRPDPMAQMRGMQMIDLSVSLENEAAGELFPPSIEYTTHEKGGETMKAIFQADSDDLVFSDGHGWAVETITTGSHTSTHIDAPYHFGATSEGKPAKTIDEVPLEWCFGPGVLLDLRHKEKGELITIADLRAALVAIDYELKPLDIVMIHTGAAKRWGTVEYFQQPGLGRESTLWLVEQGIKMIGIDAWTLDRSFGDMITEFRTTGDGHAIWPAHFAGITKEYCQIEKLTNLDLLPRPHGFMVSCMPVKIKGGSAGWCRAVALVPDSSA